MFVLTDCRISTGRGDETRRAHLYVRAGRFVEIADGAAAVRPGFEAIDAGGLLALPGAIDPHVHFDTPGFTHREDFAHGTAAAAAGGVTTVIDMPCTSLPPVTGRRALQHKLAALAGQAHVDFALWGGASGNLLLDPRWPEHLTALAQDGGVGFKTYLLSGMETFAELAPEQLAAVMAHAAALGLPVGLHAEDPGLVRERAQAAAAAGRNDWDAVADVRADPVEDRAHRLRPARRARRLGGGGGTDRGGTSRGARRHGGDLPAFPGLHARRLRDAWRVPQDGAGGQDRRGSRRAVAGAG
jgi:dihydroorotase-like cyclic amidohydrolase